MREREREREVFLETAYLVETENFLVKNVFFFKKFKVNLIVQ